MAEVAPQLLNSQIQGGRGTTAAGGRGLGGILEAGPVAPAPQEENKARYVPFEEISKEEKDKGPQ